MDGWFEDMQLVVSDAYEGAVLATTDAIESAVTAWNALSDTARAQTMAQLDRLNDAGARFAAAYADFSALAPELAGTTYEGEYQALRARADTVNATLNAIADAARTVFGWARRAVGLDGIRAQLAGMGALPAVLGYAFIAAAVAGALAVTNEMVQFTLNYRLVRDGRPPLVTGGSGSVIAQTGSVIRWAVVAGAVLLIAPRVLDMMGSKR